MEFTSFKTLVRDEVAKRTGEQFHVRINEVTKNNGVVLSGITMLQDDNNISPTIYLNQYYEAYEIDKRSDLFHMLTRMQDEVHRFTINQHKDLRSEGNLSSILDNIDGIGPKRRNMLLKKYKTITRLKELSLEELKEILPDNVAIELHDFLKKYEK